MSKFSLYLTGIPQDEQIAGGIVGWTSTSLEDKIYLVKGPYKLISLFTKILFTKKNSVIGNPDEGTDLPDLVGSVAGDAQELQDLILIAIDDAFNQVVELQQKADVLTDLDDSELIKSATLVNFVASSDATGFVAYVEIENIEGLKVGTQIPISSR